MLAYVCGMADRDYDLRDVLDTYRRDGSMIREKSRVMLEEWIEKIYPRMCDAETPTSVLLDIGKAFMELGDMKPKQNAQVASGPGFSITISLPQGEGKPPITIEGKATPPAGAEDSGDGVEGDILPPRPEYILDMPVALLNEELAGGA